MLRVELEKRGFPLPVVDHLECLQIFGLRVQVEVVLQELGGLWGVSTFQGACKLIGLFNPGMTGGFG